LERALAILELSCSSEKAMTDAALSARPNAGVKPARAAAFVCVDVYDTPAEILTAWRELEEIAPCSSYQTRAFGLAWLATLGKARDITPLFIAAKDAGDRVVALFCLGLEKRGGLTRAIFLGGKESNFNLGLFRSPETFGRADLEMLLRDAAKKLGRAAPDLFVLLNQPYDWGGVGNPCALLPHQASPSYAFATRLPCDAEQYFAAHQSKERRKKLRKKEARLAEMGELRHLTNADQKTAQAIFSAYVAHKVARNETQAIGVDFADPDLKSFYARLSLPTGDRAPALALHALACGPRIVAVFGGMAHRDCFNGMVVSYDCDNEIARSSPGELLLTRAIVAQCQNGITHFDLGIGEADYKATYCETPIALFDTVFAISVKGRLYAACESLRLRVKRAVKQRPQLFAAIRKAERALRRAKN
jgi:CelD/BcsL family acetyltransferase involved in cellulose biosynthesis